MTAWQWLCIETTYFRHSDHIPNVFDGVKVRRTGWPRQNIHSVSLQKRHSLAAEWQDAPPASGEYSCYTNYNVYGIIMHNIMPFKFVPDLWLKQKCIILWKIILELTFAIRFVSSMLNIPRDLLASIMNHPTKERLQYHVKPASKFEPAHEIMALFVLCKLILQMRMHSYPMWLLKYLIFGWTVCLLPYFMWRTAKALARLRGYAGSPKPSLVACVVSTIISRAGSFDKKYLKYKQWQKDITEK